MNQCINYCGSHCWSPGRFGPKRQTENRLIVGTILSLAPHCTPTTGLHKSCQLRKTINSPQHFGPSSPHPNSCHSAPAVRTQTAVTRPQSAPKQLLHFFRYRRHFNADGWCDGRRSKSFSFVTERCGLQLSAPTTDVRKTCYCRLILSCCYAHSDMQSVGECSRLWRELFCRNCCFLSQ
jgi:hypothetical protein